MKTLRRAGTAALGLAVAAFACSTVLAPTHEIAKDDLPPSHIVILDDGSPWSGFEHIVILDRPVPPT